MFTAWVQLGLESALRVATLFRFKANTPLNEATSPASLGTLVGSGVSVANNKLTFSNAVAYMTWPRVGFEANEDFTIECKVNYSSIGSGQGGGGGGLMSVWKVGGGDGTDNIWNLYMSGGKPGFTAANGTGSAIGGTSSSTALAANTNHHIAVTRRAGVLTIWANGVAVATSTYAGAMKNSSLPCATRWYTASGSLDNGFIGTMWDMRIVKGTAVYTSTFTPAAL